MKNKVIAVLVLATVSFGQDSQAMAGLANKFAQSFGGIKRVARELTEFAVITGTGLFCGCEAILYYEDKEFYKRLENESLAPLSPTIEKEVQALFTKHGFSPEIDNSGLIPVTGVAEHPDGTVALGISELDRCILAHDRLDICRGKSVTTLEKKHVMTVLGGHEVDHLLHHDSAEKIKKIHKINCALAALNEQERESFYYEQMRSLAKTDREKEERSDKNAAYNMVGRDADPEILAQHTENLAHYLHFMIPAEQEMLKTLKQVPEKDREDYKLFFDHPLAFDRIAYLTELAAEFRAKKTMALKVAAFAKQQRAELGKLFRGEFKK